MVAALSRALARAKEEEEEEARRAESSTSSSGGDAPEEEVDELSRRKKRKLPDNLGELIRAYELQEFDPPVVHIIAMAPEWAQDRNTEDVTPHPRYQDITLELQLVSSDNVLFCLSINSLPSDCAEQIQALLGESTDELADFGMLHLGHPDKDSAIILELILDLTINPPLAFKHVVQDYTAEILLWASDTANKLFASRAGRTIIRALPYYLDDDPTQNWKLLRAIVARGGLAEIIHILRREVQRALDKLWKDKWPCYFCYWQRIKGHQCAEQLLYDLNTWTVKQRNAMKEESPAVLHALQHTQSAIATSSRSTRHYELQPAKFVKEFESWWKDYHAERKEHGEEEECLPTKISTYKGKKWGHDVKLWPYE